MQQKSNLLNKIPPKYDLLLIILGAVFFFFPFLGGVHLFDWDEINFAECAREMIVTGDYLRVHIDYQPFWEKPPLFFWLQALSMRLFGVGEYAARLPNAICGILTLCTVYLIGKKLHNRSLAWFWVLAFGGSILPHLYFKSGIIDPWFNLFIFLGIYFLFRSTWQYQNQKNSYLFLAIAGLFTGLAILTKGPVAGLITALVLGIYWLIQRFRWFLHLGHFLFYGLFVLLTAGLWFGLEIWQNGTWFVSTFIEYQIRLLRTEDAGHGGFLGYHFVVLFLGVFPASIFAFKTLLPQKIAWPSWNHIETTKLVWDFKIWMQILFLVVLILFSLVQSKIVHYSSLCYFPLTYLAALRLNEIVKNDSILKWEKTLFWVVTALWLIVLFALPIVGQNIAILKPLLQKDLFALGNIEAEVSWTFLDFIPFLFLAILTVYFVYFSSTKGQLQKGIFGLFVGMAFFINITLIFFINKIEAYSQNAAIEFYISKQTEDCYVYPLHRTYAHMFYTLQKPTYNKKRYVKDWLLEGEIDKDVYFVSKVNHLHRIQKYKDIQEIYRKNGFVFFKRSKAIGE